MIVSIVQMNSTVGDFDGNVARIIESAHKAQTTHGADLVVFPELALCGYPPMDLLDQHAFVERNISGLRRLQRELPSGIACVIGYVNRNPHCSGKSLINAAGIIHDGKLIFEQVKTLLPTYDVFDEARNFEPASSWPIFEWRGERIGIAICEDLWRETETPGTNYAADPIRHLLDAGATLLCVPSASPFSAEKYEKRLDIARRIARRGSIPMVYANAVGANDCIIFDGRSFFLSGAVVIGAQAFQETLLSAELFHTEAGLVFRGGHEESLWKDTPAPDSLSFHDRESPMPEKAELDALEDALVLGIRDYMAKCGFLRAHLGLSGGIDSALVMYLAVRAVGAEHVTALSMPSRFSSQGSKDDAAELARSLQCRYETLPIEPVFEAFLQTLAGVFEEKPFDAAEENLQARVRGSLLMAFSNKWNSMLLATGNKSELAMGYCTLYGDMNGALAPIGDLFKTEVFALCRRINERSMNMTGHSIIPQAIIDKPPSAELRPNQKDEDTLPPYELLDEVLRLYLFKNLDAQELAARGYDGALVSKIITTVARAEFKRRQAPPVLKVSPRAFGMGRRMPIARTPFESTYGKDEHL